MSDAAAYRMDQCQARAEAADARMARIEALLMDMQSELARKPTFDAMVWMIATTVGIAAAVISMSVGVLIYLQPLHGPWR